MLNYEVMSSAKVEDVKLNVGSESTCVVHASCHIRLCDSPSMRQSFSAVHRK